MTILDLARDYVGQNECSAGYAGNLLRTARLVTRYGLETISQLTCEIVNAMFSKMPGSPQLKHNTRRELLTVWRWAFESGLTNHPPLRLKRIRVKARPVEAWSMKMLERLLCAAAQDHTPVSRRWPQVTRALVLPAWIGLGFDTGLRFADIHNLTIHSFRNNCVAVSANKTGKVTIRPVSDETADEVARLFKLSPDGTLFKWALPRRRAFVMWQTFLREQGVRGSSKYLRRSCATYVHKKAPGRASDYLSHSDTKLIWRHYLDQTLLDMPEGPPPIRRAR